MNAFTTLSIGCRSKHADFFVGRRFFRLYVLRVMYDWNRKVYFYDKAVFNVRREEFLAYRCQRSFLGFRQLDRAGHLEAVRFGGKW